MKQLIKFGAQAVFMLGIFSCTLSQSKPIQTQVEEVVIEVDENAVPGTIDYVWEEPMYDAVRVPAQLDPTSIYYRPSHKTIVEIRPRRHQKVEFPSEKAQD